MNPRFAFRVKYKQYSRYANIYTIIVFDREIAFTKDNTDLYLTNENTQALLCVFLGGFFWGVFLLLLSEPLFVLFCLSHLIMP